MEYKTITYDSNKFNHYVVYENGDVCRILKDNTHRKLKKTLSKKGGVEVTLCSNKYRKTVKVMHLVAAEFLGLHYSPLNRVMPIDGDVTNTNKDNLDITCLNVQVKPEPKKRDGVVRYCRVCDYEVYSEDELDEFVTNTGCDYNKANLCKSCRKAQRRDNEHNCGLFSMLIERGRVNLVGEGTGSYYERNKEKVKAATALYSKLRPEISRKARKKYEENNKGKVRESRARAKKNRKLRVPKWLTEDDYWMMQIAYETAAERTEKYGVQFHVDHVIPLNGEKVSGFHCPENLQVIPWHENLEKSNKFEPYWISQQLKG